MIQLRKAADRGHANHGWLDTFHTFSFADYYDPAQMSWGALRVINDDRVAPGMGFGTHGHRDMEIITYVLEGSLQHKDSMGNGTVIEPGDVQRMSAGKGVMHSEFNPSSSEPVHLLQIWITPNVSGIRPSYEQKRFDAEDKRGRLRLVASGDGREGSVTIHQDAAVYAALLEQGQAVQRDTRTVPSRLPACGARQRAARRRAARSRRRRKISATQSLQLDRRGRRRRDSAVRSARLKPTARFPFYNPTGEIIMTSTTESTLQSYGALLLRLSLGAMFVAHGLLKVLVFTLPGTVQFFESQGFPGVLAYLVIAAEIGGGMLLLAGIRTRWVALALVPVLLGAATVHIPNGWVFSAPGGGWEYPVFLAIAAVVQSLIGEGAWALSNLRSQSGNGLAAAH